MEKVTILVALQRQEEALARLRTLGVVHIKHLQTPCARDVTVRQQIRERLDEMLEFLEESQVQKPLTAPDELLYLEMDVIRSLHAEYHKTLKEIKELEKNLAWFDMWGDIRLSSLKELEKRDIFVKLYVCPKGMFKKLPKESTPTVRQLEVLSLCASYPDATSAELANRLGIANSTFRNLLSEAYLRLDVRNRTSAIAKARQLGLISPETPTVDL